MCCTPVLKVAKPGLDCPFGVPQNLYVSALSVIPIILYCSPAIFPGLPKQDFALLRRSIKLISNVCGLSFSYLTNLVCERHIKSSSDFAERILADSEHPLHEELSKARSHTFTRSLFKLLPSKTAAYCNSVLPSLSRLLVYRNA